MTLHLIDPEAPAQISAAIEAGRLISGSWGGGEAVCMMSAMVSGANSVKDCVTAGWPEWLANLNIHLFDAEVGAADEDAARAQFAMDVAIAVSVPRDYDRARDLFLIRRLGDGDYSALKSLRLNSVDAEWWRDCEAAIERVIDLLRRRLAGEDVVAEVAHAAAHAAYAAEVAHAARAAYAAEVAHAAARAAYAAASASADAARAAAHAAHAAYAAEVAHAARAAYAAARADLTAALNKA